MRFNTTRNVQLLTRIKIYTRLVKLEALQCQLATEFNLFNKMHSLFFIKTLFFPAEAEYSYFSTDLRLKIFL